MRNDTLVQSADAREPALKRGSFVTAAAGQCADRRRAESGDGGALSQGQGNALTSKLNNVIAKLDKGQTNAACNQLNAFINQVNALIDSGALTSTQGQALINAANATRTNVGC